MSKHWKGTLALLGVAAAAALVWSAMALGGGGKPPPPPPPPPPEPSNTYKIHTLVGQNPFFPNKIQSEAKDVNNNGWVVGFCLSPTSTETIIDYRAFVIVPKYDENGKPYWREDDDSGSNTLLVLLDDLANLNVDKRLPTTGFHFYYANAINDSGQITGVIRQDTNSHPPEFDWDYVFRCQIEVAGDGTLTMKDLQIRLSYANPYLRTYYTWEGINDRGDVVGTWQYDNEGNNDGQYPFLWIYDALDSNELVTILTPAGAHGRGINNLRQVVGEYETSQLNDDFLYTPYDFNTPYPGSTTNIPDFGYSSKISYTYGRKAYAITEDGYVVGREGNVSKNWAYYHAYLYDSTNGILQDLGTLAGDNCSEAYSINSSKDVVGQSYYDTHASNFRAFLYTTIKGSTTKMAIFNLQNWITGYPPGYTNTDRILPYRINDNKQICGRISNNGSEAILLEPIPNPPNP
jgi:uncharacterized membrane protein